LRTTKDALSSFKPIEIDGFERFANDGKTFGANQ
jgi:hypothetical protein